LEKLPAVFGEYAKRGEVGVFVFIA